MRIHSPALQEPPLSSYTVKIEELENNHPLQEPPLSSYTIKIEELENNHPLQEPTVHCVPKQQKLKN